jgi:hypothetical protein
VKKISHIPGDRVAQVERLAIRFLKCNHCHLESKQIRREVSGKGPYRILGGDFPGSAFLVEIAALLFFAENRVVELAEKNNNF